MVCSTSRRTRTSPTYGLAYAHMTRASPTIAMFNGIRLSDDGESDPSDLHLAWLSGARAIGVAFGDSLATRRVDNTTPRIGHMLQ